MTAQIIQFRDYSRTNLAAEQNTSDAPVKLNYPIPESQETKPVFLIEMPQDSA